MPVLTYMTEGYDLTGDNATLNISQQAHVSGDVHATSSSSIRIGSENPGSVSSSVSLFWLPGCSADITRRTTVPSPAVRGTSV
ncbi:hypothetical protein ACVV4I_03755 [Escherichia coli]